MSYVKGLTSLNAVLGRVRKALKSYGVALRDIDVLLKNVEVDPKVAVPVEVRREKIKELEKAIENLKE